MTRELPDGDIDRLIELSGIRRVHVLAWRDLEDPEAGGSELHLHEVLARWAAAGLNVHLRTSAFLDAPTTVGRAGYEVQRKGGRYQVFPRAVLAEIAKRSGSRDALVEVWNGVPFLIPLWALGPKLVFQHHDHGELWPLAVSSKWLATLGSKLEHRLAPRFYRNTPIVTLSESSKAELVANLGHCPDQVHVVPPGVGRQFRPATESERSPVVLSVGRLTHAKRLHSLVQVFGLAAEKFPGLKLEIVGDGPEAASIQRLVRDLGLTKSVTLHGRLSPELLLQAYQRARVVASASISEGWGMTLTEGAACGTPAVATDIPGHRDAVIHGQSGLLARSDEEMVECLLKVVGPQWKHFSKGALAMSRAFDWDRTATESFRVLASSVSA